VGAHLFTGNFQVTWQKIITPHNCGLRCFVFINKKTIARNQQRIYFGGASVTI
jgi:hypothetical protein